MKLRYVLWPVVVFGALSLTGACSSDSGDSSNTGATGGQGDGEGGSGTHTGATSSTGNSGPVGGTSDAGAATGGDGTGAMTTGGAPVGTGGASGGAGGAPGGLCEGLDLSCADDNNPCTEDECNPDTGKCGTPRTGTSCDDNIYCNGADTCDAGKCTEHAGNPCGKTCNEGGKYCECGDKSDCPADEPGDFTACNYADVCATTATQSRPVTTYSCNGVGKCIGAATIEMKDCTRDTAGAECASDSLRCDGTESCKGGKCTPSKVNPCVGNAAGTACSETHAECGVCSGNAVQGAYPGCAAGQFCCYNVSPNTNVWACGNKACPFEVKTISATTALPAVGSIKPTFGVP